MRVFVIGSGAISSLYAGYLAKGGIDVTMVARNAEVAERIKKEGLRIEGIRGEHTIQIPVVTDVGDDSQADLVLICVKAYDTAGAVEQHAKLFGENTLAVTVQNGIGNVEEVTQRIGEKNVLAGTTTMGAFVAGPGVVNHAGEGETTIGEVQGGKSERAAQIAERLTAAGLPTKVSENINVLLWTKLCINVAINPMTALLRVRNGVLAEHEETRSIMLAGVDETVALARKLGIELEGETLRARVIEVAQLTAKNKSSMLVDSLKGKRTEIGYINSAVARLGREHGVPTPVNDVLANLVSALEATGAKRVESP